MSMLLICNYDGWTPPHLAIRSRNRDIVKAFQDQWSTSPLCEPEYQTHAIATSTKVDISGVDVTKFDDKYFAREKKQKAKKIEGKLLETEEIGVQESKSLPDFKNDDQKAVDAPLIKAIEAVYS